jgi:YD repeat-containing protein
MKKLLALVVASAMLATPALAAIKVEFKRDTGETQVVTLDGAGTATLPDGQTIPYTYDEASLTLCFTTPDQKRCVTFAEAKTEPKAGDTVRYTAADGAKGTATVLEVTAPPAAQ